MSHTVCEKCGAYTHDYQNEESHGFIGLEPCPNMSESQIKNKLIEYFKVFQEHHKKYSNTRSNAQRRINESSKQAEFWKGKYFVVKTENNALRKRFKDNQK